MRRAILAVAAALLTGPGAAQTDPLVAAERAIAAVDAAADRLAAARSARDRIAALTQTVRAYEAGLAALREGLRRAAAAERRLAGEFEREAEALAQLLGVLQTIERTPEPAIVIHPEGPLGTARAGMILADVAPALAAEAAALRARLEEVAALRAVEQSMQDRLTSGLTGAQEARARLSEALADRRPVPEADGADLIALAESADTLAAFAAMLRDTDAPAPALPDIAAARGTLPLPVRGTILRRFGQADAAGIARPGWVVATAPGALVTNPWPATVRYAGPFPRYETVIVLEPQRGVLVVLTGLDTIYVRSGDVLAAGAPLGLMGGETTQAAASAAQSETLYLEVREGDRPVDPEAWFAEIEDET